MPVVRTSYCSTSVVGPFVDVPQLAQRAARERTPVVRVQHDVVGDREGRHHTVLVAVFGHVPDTALTHLRVGWRR